jgi:hypothetical protein
MPFVCAQSKLERMKSRVALQRPSRSCSKRPSYLSTPRQSSPSPAVFTLFQTSSIVTHVFLCFFQAALCLLQLARARAREREREREGEKKIDGLCEALPVSNSGSVNPGETLSGGSILHRYYRWVHVSVGAGNKDLALFNLRLAEREKI